MPEKKPATPNKSTTAKKSTSKAASIDDVKAVEKLREAREQILSELRKSIVGMDDVIDQVMISVFSRGHSLLEGVPGLAKTLLISSIAKCLSLSFRRIQFTPDLMPSDITGAEVLQDDPESGQRKFTFSKGPIFANLVLADEINRTPPKTQASLLEAMQEKMVSAGGEDYKLDLPFFVLATQNPLEQEGTYPLPEAQLDRFMFKIHVDYPTEQEEIDIMKQVTTGSSVDPKSVLSKKEILSLQDLVLRVPVADFVYQYAAKLVRATRPGQDDALDFINEWVSFGTGPRACLNLVMAGKARAILHGRFNVSIDDIQTLALPVMRHRMGLNFAAQSEGKKTDDIVRQLLDEIPADEKLYDSKSA